jgi:hypothetical protein
MIDGEWDAWQSSWTSAAGPLPDIRARARREATLHRLSTAAFFVLVAIGVLGSIPAFADSSRAVQAVGWAIVTFCAAMSIGYVAIQRGAKANRAGAPREDLAFLERRLRVEKRTAHLVRWVYLALFVFFAFVFPRVVAGHESPRLEMAISYSFMSLALAATFTAPWWVARKNRRWSVEIEQWRRWIEEQGL